MNNSLFEQDADNLEYSKPTYPNFMIRQTLPSMMLSLFYIYNYAEPEDENQSTVYLNYSSNWGSWGYYGYRTYSPTIGIITMSRLLFLLQSLLLYGLFLQTILLWFLQLLSYHPYHPLSDTPSMGV